MKTVFMHAMMHKHNDCFDWMLQSFSGRESRQDQRESCPEEDWSIQSKRRQDKFLKFKLSIKRTFIISRLAMLIQVNMFIKNNKAISQMM